MIQLIACDNNQSDNHTVFLFELRIDKTFEDVKRIGFSVTDPYKKTTFCSLNINVEVYKVYSKLMNILKYFEDGKSKS